MNWRTQLQAPTAAAPAIAPVQAAHPMVAQLRAAAALFAPRTDSFAEGKSATCLDIAAKLERFGSFASDKQREFAEKLITWSKPRQTFQSDAVKQNQQTSGVFGVPNLFTVMQKHSRFHAGEMRITRKNQDTLCWIVWTDVCIGKIENGTVALFGKRIHAAGALQQTVVDLLKEFETNPLAAAVKYGKLSGRCCSCGRDLTDPASIEAGIGPICAGKF